MMTKRDLKIVEDAIHVAVQSAVGPLQQNLMTALEQQVKTTVNGQITGLRTSFESYRADDEKWKRENQPALDNMKSITISAKTIFWLVLGIGGFSAFLANLSSIISTFKPH